MSTVVKMFCYFILQVTLLLSVLFLLRGHNHPGGGFIAALIASTGIGFYTLTYEKLPGFLHQRHIALVYAGVCFLLVSQILPVIFQQTFLTGMWLSVGKGFYEIKVGTPLLFDVGVYCCVFGSMIRAINYLESNADD